MKTVGIEELLTWAFTQELVKGGGTEGIASIHSAWRLISELGVRVSSGTVGSGYGHDNFLIEQGEPHEDALAVGEAVAALRGCDIVVPDAWTPVPEWSGDATFEDLARDAVDRAVARFRDRSTATRAEHLVTTVIGVAILRREPDWQAEPPRVRIVERGGKPAWFLKRQSQDGFGRPILVEVDGFNPRSQRPLRGAYRKYEFSDDPAGDILGRLDHQCWVAALWRLHLALVGRLSAHRLAPFERPLAPWAPGREPVIALVERERKKSAA